MQKWKIVLYVQATVGIICGFCAVQRDLYNFVFGTQMIMMALIEMLLVYTSKLVPKSKLLNKGKLQITEN